MTDHATPIMKLQRTRTDVVAALDTLDQSDKPVELDQTLQGRLSRMDAIAQQHMAKAGCPPGQRTQAHRLFSRLEKPKHLDAD